MGPIAVSFLTGGAFYAFDKWRERRAHAAAGLVADPVRFAPAQLAQFSHQIPETGARHFDRDVGDNIITAQLAERSATAMPAAAVGKLAHIGQVWRIGPVAPGAFRASDVIASARSSGLGVLGSHSLVFLPEEAAYYARHGSVPVMLIITGERGAIERAASGVWAVLDPPAPPAPAAEPPAEVVAEPAPIAKPRAKASNGARNGHKPTDPVVVDATAEPVEER